MHQLDDLLILHPDQAYLQRATAQICKYLQKAAAEASVPLPGLRVGFHCTHVRLQIERAEENRARRMVRIKGKVSTCWFQMETKAVSERQWDERV